MVIVPGVRLSSRMVYLNSRRLLVSHYHNSTVSLRLPLCGMRALSPHTQQLSLHSQQRIVDTVEDSVHRTEMVGLESQEEDTPKCILFFKVMS